MLEYELLCEREKQLTKNICAGNKNIKSCNNWDEYDNEHKNQREVNSDNKTICKSLNNSIEDILNCNDISISVSASEPHLLSLTDLMSPDKENSPSKNSSST